MGHPNIVNRQHIPNLNTNHIKIGMRKPSLKKMISARTTGRAKRTVKRALIPGYGQRGMGLLHPKRALYNMIYRRTTFSIST